MDRAYFASVCSIILIVGIVAVNFHQTSTSSNFGTTPAVTLGGNAFQTAVAAGAPIDTTPLSPFRVTLQANGGTVAPGSTLTVAGDTFRYTTESGQPGTLQAVAIELPGSATARSVRINVARSTSPDWTPAQDARDLAVTQSDDGTWYTLLDAKELVKLRATQGDGWYVFTATATRGTEHTTQRIAFFLA